jgi:hypothetical protein
MKPVRFYSVDSTYLTPQVYGYCQVSLANLLYAQVFDLLDVHALTDITIPQ